MSLHNKICKNNSYSSFCAVVLIKAKRNTFFCHNKLVCAECISNYRMEQLIMFLILGMMQKLYPMKGSSPDTLGYRDPQKAHGIPAVLDFYSFSPA